MGYEPVPGREEIAFPFELFSITEVTKAGMGKSMPNLGVFDCRPANVLFSF